MVCVVHVPSWIRVPAIGDLQEDGNSVKWLSKYFVGVAAVYMLAASLYFAGESYYLFGINGLLAATFLYGAYKLKRQGL